jgi:hypothetical protein
MAVSKTLQKTVSVGGTGAQDPDFVVDAGAYRYVAARLKCEGVSGSGSIVVTLQHAAVEDDSEFEDQITFDTITDGSSFPTIDIKTSEVFARYLRWSVTTFTGITAAKINIELVLKN